MNQLDGKGLNRFLRKMSGDNRHHFLIDRKFLSASQLALGIVFGIGTFIIPHIIEDKPWQIGMGLIFTIVVFVVMYIVNIYILMPLNMSEFAKKIYKYDKENGYQLSPATIRFVENLDHRENLLVERGIGFLFLTSPIELHYDVVLSGKISYAKPILLWIKASNCLNLFFDNESEVQKLMDMSLIRPTQFRGCFLDTEYPKNSIKNFDSNNPLLLYKPGVAIRIIPYNSMQFECYEGTYRASELLLSCKSTKHDYTAYAVIAENLKGVADVEICGELKAIDKDGSRWIEHGSFKKVQPWS